MYGAPSVAHTLRSANPRKWLVTLAKFGHAVKGLVYVLIGVLTLKASATGRRPEGNEGAVREIGQQPFGDVWLVVMGVGFASYALWRFVQAFADPDGDGRGLKAIAKRIGYACSGFVHGALALAGFQLALGSGHDGDATRTWVGKLLEQPFGGIVLIAIGAGIVLSGLGELFKAMTASFQKDLDTSRMTSDGWRWVRRFGRFGYFAHGVVLPIIGVFLIRAALEINPSRAKGVAGALREVQTEPHGATLLAIVAGGLAAHGVFMLICAKYRRIRTP